MLCLNPQDIRSIACLPNPVDVLLAHLPNKSLHKAQQLVVHVLLLTVKLRAWCTHLRCGKHDFKSLFSLWKFKSVSQVKPVYEVLLSKSLSVTPVQAAFKGSCGSYHHHVYEKRLINPKKYLPVAHSLAI